MHMRKLAVLSLLFMLLADVSPASAAQVTSSMTRGVRAVTQASGFYLQPIGVGQESVGDLAPPQLFEIARPANQPITIGRLFTSCSCVTLESDERSFSAGEPAVLRLRNVRATPPSGQNYAIYVQITSPIRTTLRLDTFMQSSQFIPAAAGLPPTRGNIVADGVFSGQTTASGYTGEIEIIVPKADNYIAAPQRRDDVMSEEVAALYAEMRAAIAKSMAAREEEMRANAKAAASDSPDSGDAPEADEPEAGDESKVAEFRDDAAKFGRAVKEKTVAAGKSVARAVENAPETISEKSAVAAEKAADAWEVIKDKSRAAGRYIDDKTQPARDAVSEKVEDAVDAVKDAFSKD